MTIALNCLPLADMNPYAIAGRSLYGMRINPATGAYKMHEGVDDPEAVKTPIIVVAPCQKVLISRMQTNRKGYGNYIVLRHNGFDTIYPHQSKRILRVGDSAPVGSVLGLIGSTGDSTGPHLHFGMCENFMADTDEARGWMDPLPFLKTLYDKLHPAVKLLPIKLNGVIVRFSAVSKNGLNYIKLRDLASAMPDRVSFVYNAKTGVTTVNGKKFSPAMINVGGFNFVQLRDAATLIGTFTVGYDTMNNIPMINAK